VFPTFQGFQVLFHVLDLGLTAQYFRFLNIVFIVMSPPKDIDSRPL